MPTTSTYPAALDTFAAHGATMDVAEEHENLHLTMEDAIEKIEGELGTDPAGSAATVKARFEAIPNSTLVRHRRNRNGLAIAGAGTTAMFAGSATGTPVENVGGITFTTNATNGFLTVPVAGSYAITSVIDPAAVMGATATMNFIINSSTHQIPLVGGSVFSDASLVKYLATGSTVAVSVSNPGAGTTADTWEIEVVKLA